MLKKTIIKKAAAVLTAALCLSSSMTAFAAPETMPSGAIFDAEYYARTYPDVAAVLGTDKEALYGHYAAFGWNEGRLAFEGDTPHSANLNAAQQTENNQTNPIIGVQGVIGGSYQLPTWGNYEGSDQGKSITMQIDTKLDENFLNMDWDKLAQYSMPGYRWRFIHYTVTGAYDENNKKLWAIRSRDYDVERSKDWAQGGDGSKKNLTFTVTVPEEGFKDYTGCRLLYTYNGETGDLSYGEGFYVLLPESYKGKAFFTINGTTPDGEGGYNVNGAAVTFVLD